jgi:hypothetical protein
MIDLNVNGRHMSIVEWPMIPLFSLVAAQKPIQQLAAWRRLQTAPQSTTN